MSKFRSLILIIGLSIIAVAAALLTVLIMYATGTIVTDPIELVFTVGSDKKYYDGTPLTLSDDAYVLESGEILEGHTAQVKIIGSQTNAGESESTLEVKIVDKNGFDVSDEYAVKVNTGTLKVEKQNLSVVIEDSSVPYSGKRVYFNDYTILKGKLAKGHKIAGVNVSLLNVDDVVPEDITPVVYDAFDNDVSANYEFLDFDVVGKVEITARPLTIRPKDISKVYDGTPLTAEEYEIVSGSLAPGQSVQYEIYTTGGDKATFVDCTDGERITFYGFKIVDETGKEVDNWEKNYDCNYMDTAILKIEKRPITIATATQTFIYDGEEHYNDSVQILAGSLAANQILAIDTATKVTDVIENKPNVIVFTIKLKDGTSVYENYDITPVTGTLSVKPYNLTVYTKSYTKVYDGKPMGDYIDADVTNYELKTDLPSKFTITYDYSNTVKEMVDVIGETSYSLINVSVKISGEDGDIDCKDNFFITVKEGKYSITKKSATVQSPSATFTYDGTEHYVDDESKCVVSGLIEGHRIELTDYTKVTNVSDSGLNVISYKIVSDTEDVNKDNYDIKESYGTLTVTQKHLSIQSGSKSFEYDGNEHDYREEFKTVGLLSIHTFTINDSTKVKDVEGDVPNIFDYSITKDGEDVIGNYQINFVAGRLTVIQKSVTVTTADGEKVYDADPLTKEGGTPVGLLGNHELSLIGEAPSITDVGTLTNEQKFDVVDKTTGEIVTNNYKLIYDYGTLEVTPKTESVSLNTELGKEYDGVEYDLTNTNAFVGVALPDGINAADFKIVRLSEMKNAGTYYYTAEYTGESKNYNLTVNEGKVVITRKSVILTYGGAPLSMTYNGKDSLYTDDATVIDGLSVGDIGTVQSAVLIKTSESVSVKSVTVYGDDGDITTNLDVDCSGINLEVTLTQRAFSLNLAPYSNTDYVNKADLPSCVSASGLAAGDQLVITAEQFYTDNYSYYIVTGYDIVNSDGESVRDHYTTPDLGARGKVTIIYSF